MENRHSAKKPRFFYGYRIVAVTFFFTFIFSGCAYYTFSLFVKPLEAEFGWSRGGIMVAFTIFFLIMGVSAPFIGRLVDRYGASRVTSIGAFTAGLGFVLLSQMNNLWYLYSGYVIIGAGMAAVGPVPATTVVSNWFKKKRGTAIGIMATGIGAGGLVLAPFVGGYLIPNFGWQTSYIVLALLTWLLIPLALWVIKTRPADLGLLPDGLAAPEAVTEAKASPPAAGGLTPRMALASLGFWLIAVSFLTNGFSHVGIIQNQAPHLEDIGFPVATAATTLGVLGLGSLIGKFFFGWLCDQIPAKYAWCISLGLQLTATLIIMNIQPASPTVMIWLYAMVMGLGVGGWLPTMSMLVSTNFGLASYGAIFGLITLAQSTGAAAGPLFAGYMYDTMDSYRLAFIVFLALYTVAVPAILALRRPKLLS